MTNFFWLAIAACGVAVALVVIPLMRSNVADKGNRLRLAVFISVVLPVGVFSIYKMTAFDDQDLIDKVIAAAPELSGPASLTESTTSRVDAPPISELAEKLARRLEASPDDPQGWALLAQSYRHMGMPNKEKEAYQRAVALGYDADRLNDRVQQAASSSNESSVRIAGELTASDTAAASMQAGDTIFLIARKPGPSRVPVAVQRHTAMDLPLKFVLSDSDVMFPGSHLSDYETLEISARVSKSGMAEPTANDLYATAQSISAGENRSVVLLIDAQ